jgi:hypothetical protein
MEVSAGVLEVISLMHTGVIMNTIKKYFMGIVTCFLLNALNAQQAQSVLLTDQLAHSLANQLRGPSLQQPGIFDHVKNFFSSNPEVNILNNLRKQKEALANFVQNNKKLLDEAFSSNPESSLGKGMCSTFVKELSETNKYAHQLPSTQYSHLFENESLLSEMQKRCPIEQEVVVQACEKAPACPAFNFNKIGSTLHTIIVQKLGGTWKSCNNNYPRLTAIVSFVAVSYMVYLIYNTFKRRRAPVQQPPVQQPVVIQQALVQQAPVQQAPVQHAPIQSSLLKKVLKGCFAGIVTIGTVAGLLS